MPTTIAVTGKGGTGKTTVAALIISYLKQSGTGAVLAVDADPDYNLGTVLGIDVEQSIGDIREDALEPEPFGLARDVDLPQVREALGRPRPAEEGL